MSFNMVKALAIMALRRMDNLILAVATNALATTGKVEERSYIPKECKAYSPLLENNLIDEDGKPKDGLEAALDYVINERVLAGTWN